MMTDVAKSDNDTNKNAHIRKQMDMLTAWYREIKRKEPADTARASLPQRRASHGRKTGKSKKGVKQ